MSPTTLLDPATELQEIQRTEELVELEHECAVSKIQTARNYRLNTLGFSTDKLQGKGWRGKFHVFKKKHRTKLDYLGMHTLVIKEQRNTRKL